MQTEIAKAIDAQRKTNGMNDKNKQLREEL